MKQVLFKCSILFLLLLLAQTNVLSQTQERVIKMDKASEEDDDEVYLQLTEIKVGAYDVPLNKSFSADDNWLKDLKIKVKNISGKTMTCVSVSLGLIEGLNEIMAPEASWGWIWGFNYGECSSFIRKDAGQNFKLKNGQEIELTYANISPFVRDSFEKAKLGTYQKAIMLRPMVIFKGESLGKLSGHDTYLKISESVEYFDYDVKW